MTNQNELHVVFGASGGIGNAVVRELVARGKRVRAANRSGKAIVPAQVELRQGDASDPASARDVCEGATVVYNCTNAPYTEWPTKFPPMMAGIIEGAASANAKLVFADNVYVYGRLSGPMTEKTPSNATGHKGKTRIQMAEMLMDAHKRGKLRATIGRASDYYGPGVTNSAIGETLFRAVLDGKKAMWVGSLDVPHSVSYIDDFARGLVTLGERDEAIGEIWHIPAGEPLTGRQFLQWVFEEARMPPKIGVYKRLMMTLISPFVPLVREVMETLYQFEEPFVLDGSKYTRTFGDSTVTPHREGIRRTLDWFRLNSQTVW